MSDVTATAAVIARVRAREHEKPAAQRLFSDPYAHLFGRLCSVPSGDALAHRSPQLPDHPAEDAAAEALIAERYEQVPFFREQVLLRTRFIDEALVGALATGVRQVLLLGAGFDCRALRLHEVEATQTRVFEVDLPGQLERKRAILTAGGHAVPAWDIFVPCDLAAAGLEHGLAYQLEAAGYDPGARTFVVLEGVVNYLEANEVDRTLRSLAAGAARPSQIVFNYASFRIDPAALPARLEALGYRRVETWPGSALYMRYYGEPPPETIRSAADAFLLSMAET